VSIKLKFLLFIIDLDELAYKARDKFEYICIQNNLNSNNFEIYIDFLGLFANKI